jgi:hypothetical protein
LQSPPGGIGFLEVPTNKPLTRFVILQTDENKGLILQDLQNKWVMPFIADGEPNPDAVDSVRP